MRITMKNEGGEGHGTFVAYGGNEFQQHQVVGRWEISRFDDEFEITENPQGDEELGKEVVNRAAKMLELANCPYAWHQITVDGEVLTVEVEEVISVSDRFLVSGQVFLTDDCAVCWHGTWGEENMDDVHATQIEIGYGITWMRAIWTGKMPPEPKPKPFRDSSEHKVDYLDFSKRLVSHFRKALRELRITHSTYTMAHTSVLSAYQTAVLLHKYDAISNDEFDAVSDALTLDHDEHVALRLDA